MAIILASASPRRRQLLEQVGCVFEVIASSVVENDTQRVPPVELAISLAKAKALDVAAKLTAEDIIIGADTIVVCKGSIYGKPVNIDNARRMLSELSGQRHQVITGVAVVKGQEVYSDFAVTDVQMRCLSITEIERYLDSGEPFGKAGAYAIQGLGALLVENIHGCYANVVGLPLVTLNKLLFKVGVNLL